MNDSKLILLELSPITRIKCEKKQCYFLCITKLIVLKSMLTSSDFFPVMISHCPILRQTGTYHVCSNFNKDCKIEILRSCTCSIFFISHLSAYRLFNIHIYHRYFIWVWWFFQDQNSRSHIIVKIFWSLIGNLKE